MISEFFWIGIGLVIVIASIFALAMLFRDNKKAWEIERKYESLNHLRALVEAEEKKLEYAINRTEEYERAKKFLEERPALEAEKAELIKNITGAETKLVELSGEIKKTEDGLNRLSKDAHALEEKVRQKSDILQELEREVGIVSMERDCLVKERDEVKSSLEQLQEEAKRLEDENAKLVKLNSALKDSVEELCAKKEDAEKWLMANKDKLSLAGNLEQEINQRQKRVAFLDDQLANTMKSIAGGIEQLNKMNLSGVQTLRQNAFITLKDHVFEKNELKPAADRGDSGERQALRAVANHFANIGFNVPPRLLRAFHTSLKTSDMSSLTVMAGVSGTGKSALPKLYAEAMGICFQPLAVEPRWDSPKDLLGFFNYVTNRYEPTPLARALFQFQGGWTENSKFKPDVDLHEYMFMPMLDEMNLARIEYYFSEFLSKLEMRRLEPILTEENCRSVALEVFQGFEGYENGNEITEQAIRIFANSNTLFVGTMNEDETTQSLSDKVIDRANVIYFGRPRKLQPNVPNIHAAPDVGLLPLETWNSWKKNVSDVNESELKTASGILTNLNQELAKFNRPFAHRTYQAMLSYIANYPEVETRNQALADQIGMRILPKLRGLDLSQHQATFERVRKIIGDLNDRFLSNSFEQATNRQLNRTGFFEWSGFDWDDEGNEDR